MPGFIDLCGVRVAEQYQKSMSDNEGISIPIFKKIPTSYIIVLVVVVHTYFCIITRIIYV